MTALSTDESPFMFCAATAKPGLDSSSFSWSKDGSSIDSSSSYNIGFHVGQTGSYVYGLTQSWNSSLQMDVQTKIFTCDNVVHYDGRYQCSVSEKGHSTQSTAVTLETLGMCNIFIAYSITSMYISQEYIDQDIHFSLCRLRNLGKLQNGFSTTRRYRNGGYFGL